MSLILRAFFLLSCLIPVAEASADWTTRIEAGEVILENESERLVFSKALEFRAARNELFALSTGNEKLQSRWVENESREIPTVVFERFLRLWHQSSLQPKMETALAPWTSRDGVTHLVIKKALRESAEDLSTIPLADQLWLGCYDGVSYCLGMNETVSNPNLLRDTVLKEELQHLKTEERGTFVGRTASLTLETAEAAFKRARFPQEIASWYALKVLSRKTAFATESVRNPYVEKINRYQSGAVIRDGKLLQAPPGFEVDFTIDRLDAQIREFIMARYEEVEGIAKYVLAHLPMMTYEFDKGIGNWKVGPGFMFRVKRHIVKNPNSRSQQTMYKINDSVDLIVTLNIGLHRQFGVVGASLGAGPGYMRRYLFSSFAPSREAATKSPWGLTKEMLLGYSFDQLKPLDSVTIESGWLASVSFSSNANVLGYSKVRPQLNAFSAYRWLSRSYVHIEENGDAYVGFGKSEGMEASVQSFLRVIARMAKIPFFNWSSSRMKQKGGVYRVPRTAFASEMDRSLFSQDLAKGEEQAFKNKFPDVSYGARYSTSYSYLNLGFYRIAESAWNGFFELTPAAQASIPMLEKKRRFLLLESSLDQTVKRSLSPQPGTKTCTTWSAFEATPEDPAKLFDGALKINCTEIYTNKKPLYENQLSELTEILKLQVAKENILPRGQEENQQLELNWDIQISWKDLKALFAAEPTAWIEDLSNEVLALRNREAPLPSLEEAQERLLLVTALGQVLKQEGDVNRATAFFRWVSTYPSKDFLIKALLKRLHYPAVRLQVFRPYAKESALIEQTYSYGTFEDTTPFRIIEEKNKWLGLN